MTNIAIMLSEIDWPLSVDNLPFKNLASVAPVGSKTVSRVCLVEKRKLQHLMTKLEAFLTI